MEEIINVFPRQFRPLCRIGFEAGIEPEEMRLRVGQPVTVLGKGEEYFWNLEQSSLQKHRAGCYLWKEDNMKETLSRMSQYSMYALEEEIRNGFFTIQGGHRIGVAGKTICEHGKIVTIRNICGINIRVARQKKGCAKEILPFLRQGDSIYNTLILSPPGAGKTTMLRDCIRILSDGDTEHEGYKIGVVDERSEIGAGFFGIPQNDLGIRTDVLDSCPKAEGMRMLVRSMSPKIIGVDELGSQEDYQAVEEVLHCGCRILGTMHVGKIEEMREKMYLSKWLEREFFERYLFLSVAQNGKREHAVYDGKLQQLC